jgi:hypothetical protein
MSIAGKVYNRILLLRIRGKIDSKLRPGQNGFRPHRGTTEHILAVRRLIEDTNVRKDGFLILTFIDFKKAFDSINRSRMFKVIKAYGVSDIVIKQISAMYDGTTAMVRTSDGVSKEFSINAGVLQGDTLAPFLFVWMVDYILRRAVEETGIRFVIQKRNGRRGTELSVVDFAFADDVALATHTIEEAEILLHAVEKFAAELGLLLNAGKTEFMVISGDSHIDLNVYSMKSRDGTELKRVEDFKYLGSWIRNSFKDISVRIADAWLAATKMRNIWKSHLDEDLKRQFFNSTVVSILLYGCETWSLTNTLEQRINGSYTKLLRYAMGVSWIDHVTNATLYGNFPKITRTIQYRRLRFAGHCLRASDQVVTTLVLRQPIKGQYRRGGGSTLTYPKRILKDLNDAGVDTTEMNIANISEWALDRDLWKVYLKKVLDEKHLYGVL